ncbi:pecanex-like protein 3 [Anomalospiza imberbis]|uniref:pecanex-like protein 3 n=1 Tax=Anomalospiza imberbis TaxID=187417 RepID=UPI00358EB3A7
MAGAAVLQVLRQGVWASLTGGCFLEPQLGAFANCVRLYVWLFLLGLPLGLYSALPPSPAVAALYCGLVAAFFGAVKAVTFRLHARLDRGGDPERDPEEGAAALLPPRSPEERDGTPGPAGGGLQLSVLRWPSATPPQLCGFNQLSELLPRLDTATGAGELRGILTAADRDWLRSVGAGGGLGGAHGLGGGPRWGWGRCQDPPEPPPASSPGGLPCRAGGPARQPPPITPPGRGSRQHLPHPHPPADPQDPPLMAGEEGGGSEGEAGETPPSPRWDESGGGTTKWGGGGHWDILGCPAPRGGAGPWGGSLGLEGGAALNLGSVWGGFVTLSVWAAITRN